MSAHITTVVSLMHIHTNFSLFTNLFFASERTIEGSPIGNPSLIEDHTRTTRPVRPLGK